MGQKINPTSFRLGVNQDWKSTWSSFGSESNLFFSSNFSKDIQIRKLIQGIINNDIGLISNLLIHRGCNELKYNLQHLDYNASKIITISLDLYLFQKELSHLYIEDSGNISRNTTYDVPKLISILGKPQDTRSESEVLFIHEYKSILENILSHKIRVAVKNKIEPSIPIRNVRAKLRVIFEEGSTYVEKESHFLNFCFLDLNTDLITSWIAYEVQKRKGLRDIVKKVEKAFLLVKSQALRDTDLYRYAPDGVRICCSGRFLMMENEKRRNKMARKMTFQKGVISLTTIDNLVHYSSSTAFTTDGTTGIKLWISYSSSKNRIKLGI